MEPVIQTHDRGVVRVLTLNRPQVRNAMSLDLMRELTAALTAARTDAAVRVVVLTGAGAAFCAGLDLEELKAMSARSSEEHRADSEVFRTLLDTLYTFPKPTVAAVNGHAVGGGAGLAAACDLTVMAQGARMGFTEARIGFVAALVSVFLVRLLPEKHARDLLLTGRLLHADEAARMGLVNEVTPEGKALSRALDETGLYSQPSEFRRGVISCTGLEFCKLAHVTTKARAIELVDILEDTLGDLDVPISIALNGCPNACARSQVADIGLKGQIVTDSEGNRVEGFQVHLGGALGLSPDWGRKLRGHKVVADEVPEYVIRLVNKYKEQREEGEQFRHWVLRAAEEDLQ